MSDDARTVIKRALEIIDARLRPSYGADPLFDLLDSDGRRALGEAACDHEWILEPAVPGIGRGFYRCQHCSRTKV